MDLELVSSEDIKKNHYVEYKKIMEDFDRKSYFENPECIQYKSFIKDMVESIFNIVSRDKIKNKMDFILNWNGKKLKIRHLICRKRKDKISYWTYKIDHNRYVDAFLLSAFDSGDNYIPEHLWLIKTSVTFESMSTLGRPIIGKITKKKFWNRSSIAIRDEENIISYMNRYELKEKLDQLKSLMKLGIHKPNYNLRSSIEQLLINKQRDILENTGEKRTLYSIAKSAIDSELMPKTEDEILIRRMIRKFDDKYQTQEEKMDYTYNLIVEKQKEIKTLTGEIKSIKDIIEQNIKLGIDNVK